MCFIQDQVLGPRTATQNNRRIDEVNIRRTDQHFHPLGRDMAEFNIMLKKSGSQILQVNDFISFPLLICTTQFLIIHLNNIIMGFITLDVAGYNFRNPTEYGLGLELE